MADSLTGDGGLTGPPAFGAAAVVSADWAQNKLTEDLSGAGLVDDDVFGALDNPDKFAGVGLSDFDSALAEVHRSSRRYFEDPWG
ncbi:hypothetical protein BJQ89_01390 [Arthrobacter sp. ES1]|nr:hypothetical protein [Arthrobacter sp. ES1]